MHSIPSMRILTVPSEPQITTVSADLDRASNAPINRLPLELLVEIFKELLRRIIDDLDLYPNPLTRLSALSLTSADFGAMWRTTHRRCGPLSRIQSTRTYDDICHSPEIASLTWNLVVSDMYR